MRILVIGGSYFYGRVFVMLAAKAHEVTVVNRGTYSMAELGARQVKGDRRDAAVWRGLQETYDVIVDFCAYQPGDIKNVLEHFGGSVKQYIFISTVDVYRRGDRENAEEEYRTESAVLETRPYPGEAGAYIAGKVALEAELQRECLQRQIAFTILRPAILYGPYNYAPRESAYIQMALQKRALPLFMDADGRFQFVYVKDAAEAVLRCMGREESFGQAYNLCGEEVLDYETVLHEIKALAQESLNSESREDGEAEGWPDEQAGIAWVPISLQEAEARGIPAPFPATAAETELVSNRKSREELGMVYTEFEDGMKRTFAAFRNVFEAAT